MQEFDFIKHVEKFIAIAGNKARQEYYVSDLEFPLNTIADTLLQKYAAEKLYPHISNFGTHILFRLGVHKKKSHSASVAVNFNDDTIRTGFDLTHALGDALRLKGLFLEKADEMIAALLALEDYAIYMPNGGLTESIPLDEMDEKELKKSFTKYNPTAMRECYVNIWKEYEEDSMNEEQLIEVFTQEREAFGFLLDGIKNK